MLIYFLLPLIAVALLCVPFIFTAKKIKNGKSPKGAFIGNLCTFAGIMLCALIVPVGNFVSAASEEGVKAALSTGAGLGYLAAALAVGLSCVGSGKQCREKVYDYKLTRETPLIVEIPDRHATSKISDTISHYLAEAVGIKL